MSRPKNDPGEKFGYAELALAGNMTVRAFQHVSDAQLLPAGRGISVLKRVAQIGGFVTAGLPLLASARLANMVTFEFNEYDGEIPTGLSHLATKLPRGTISSIPVDGGDYWYHRALVQHPRIYSRGHALKSDALIEIVDRRLVFLRAYSGLKFVSPYGKESFETSFIGRIEGLERGGDIRAIYITEEIGKMDDKENPGWREVGALLEVQAQGTRLNAVGIVTVNISLAVRNALDRIADHRAERLRKSA